MLCFIVILLSSGPDDSYDLIWPNLPRTLHLHSGNGMIASVPVKLPWRIYLNRTLARYVKLQFANAPGMSGTLPPPPTSKETASYRSRHSSRHVGHARAVMHVGIANPRWWRKRFRHSRRMRIHQFYVSVKRPMNQKQTTIKLSKAWSGTQFLANIATCFIHLLWASHPWN